MCKGSDRGGGQETRVLGEEGSHVRAGKAGKSQPREERQGPGQSAYCFPSSQVAR